jgi:hypothetical protein
LKKLGFGGQEGLWIEILNLETTVLDVLTVVDIEDRDPNLVLSFPNVEAVVRPNVQAMIGGKPR